MKTFRNVKVGDTIYYWSHGKMYPQIVHKIEIEDKIEHINSTWGGGYDRKITSMTIQAGKAKERTILWASDRDSDEWGSVLHFASEESAKAYINRLAGDAEWHINLGKRMIEKYSKLKAAYNSAFSKDL